MLAVLCVYTFLTVMYNWRAGVSQPSCFNGRFFSLYIYKWKNYFSEMKGDLGMSHHEKEGNKKMPRPRQETIDNPIPTSLFMYYAAVLLCVGTGGAI